MSAESVSQSRLVVVGVDGSAESKAAVAYALRNAAARGDSVRAVTAVPEPEMWATGYGVVMLPPVDELLPEARKTAQGVVDAVVAELGEAASGVSVTVDALAGTPAQVLLDAAAEATELVVGHRGRGGVRSALLGSVGLSCVLHAPCPVTVVRAAKPA
ncbi:MAG: universal stress protein [Mycobacteriaceae bacterium]